MQIKFDKYNLRTINRSCTERYCASITRVRPTSDNELSSYHL